jgi:hypothetical protein
MANELSWATLRQLVYDRADGCCEYCRTCEANIGQTMQVDHILPNNDDSLDNLCLSCWNCNTSKHQATQAIDPISNEWVDLFHPRTHSWQDHFQWIDNGVRLIGLTAIGRATIMRLKMNRPAMLVARQRWVENGYHPPK